MNILIYMSMYLTSSYCSDAYPRIARMCLKLADDLLACILTTSTMLLSLTTQKLHCFHKQWNKQTNVKVKEKVVTLTCLCQFANCCKQTIDLNHASWFSSNSFDAIMSIKFCKTDIAAVVSTPGLEP